jgi:hypothetical protein
VSGLSLEGVPVRVIFLKLVIVYEEEPVFLELGDKGGLRGDTSNDGNLFGENSESNLHIRRRLLPFQGRQARRELIRAPFDILRHLLHIKNEDPIWASDIQCGFRSQEFGVKIVQLVVDLL